MKEKLYTIKEVAEYLRVGDKMVYVYVQQKLLPAIKMKGTIRIAEKDLKAFLDDKRTVKTKNKGSK